jgi:excisionase family DNA binding protein
MPIRSVRYLVEKRVAASDAATRSTLLTAREAALCAGVNERTIRRAITRGELPATRQSGQFRIALAALQDYQRQRREHEAARRNTAPERRPFTLASLPTPPTILIGREHEMATALAVLGDPDGRLLTLTGPGGVGKTRLALAIAAASAGQFADGVVFIALEAIRDREQAIKSIAGALGVAPIEGRPLVETLCDAVRQRRQLLILDNFEHVLPAADAVAALLVAGPGLRLLVTSRETLHLRGETELVVPPLALPDLTQTPTAELIGRSPAVELFVRRARAVQPAFALTDETAPAVGAVCQRLEGLPLAIELAAARIKHATPAALLARMERRLEFLTGGARDLPQRLQTMRSAIAWSYDLLSPEEQTLLRRLAVFAGGFAPDAATWVSGAGSRVSGVRRGVEESRSREGEAGGGRSSLEVNSEHPTPDTRHPTPDVLDLLTSLVDKSLLQVQPGDDAPRFAMLETIREFAAEQLVASGEVRDVRARHASYFLTLAEDARPDFHHPGEAAALSRLETELGNFRAALTWATGEHGSTEVALRLANGLFWLWYVRGYHPEGWRWFQSVLSGPETERWPEPLANAHLRAGWLALRMGMSEQADTLITDALARCRDLHLARSAAFALGSCGFVALVGFGDPVKAAVFLEEALLAARAVGDGWLEAMDDYGLSIVALARGDLQTARAMSERSLAVSRHHGDAQGNAANLAILGQIARLSGETSEALRLFAGALEDYQRVGDRGNVCTCVESLAGLLVELGRPEQGAHLLGAAAALRQSIGTPVPGHEQARYEADVAATRAALTEDAFAVAWSAGEATSLREAVSGVAWSPPVAELVPAATAPTSTSTSRLAALTRREREILELVSAGHTDRQIGQQLSISPTTVTKHVGNVLGKLGVRSRTAAAIALLTALA